jgi:hypothetical protein
VHGPTPEIFWARTFPALDARDLNAFNDLRLPRSVFSQPLHVKKFPLSKLIFHITTAYVSFLFQHSTMALFRQRCCRLPSSRDHLQTSSTASAIGLFCRAKLKETHPRGKSLLIHETPAAFLKQLLGVFELVDHD